MSGFTQTRFPVLMPAQDRGSTRRASFVRAEQLVLIRNFDEPSFFPSLFLFLARSIFC